MLLYLNIGLYTYLVRLTYNSHSYKFTADTSKPSNQNPSCPAPKVPDLHGNPIEEHMSLLCEELEICAPLINILKKEKLVGEDIQEQINKQTGRRNKLKFLLQQIAMHGKKG